MRCLIVVLLITLMNAPAVFNGKVPKSDEADETTRFASCTVELDTVTCCLNIRIWDFIRSACIEIHIDQDSMTLIISMRYGDTEILRREKSVGRLCGPIPKVPMVELCLLTHKAKFINKGVQGLKYEGCVWLSIWPMLQLKLVCFQIEHGTASLTGNEKMKRNIKFDTKIDNFYLELMGPIKSYRALHKPRRRSGMDFLTQNTNTLKEGMKKAKAKISTVVEKGLEVGGKIHKKGESLYAEGKRVYKVGEGVYNRSKDAYESSKKTKKAVKEAIKSLESSKDKFMKRGKDIFKF